MTVYNEAIAIDKICELKSGTREKNKLIEDIYEQTKELIDIYLNKREIDSSIDIEDVRSILSLALLEAIESYSLEYMVPFSTYVYFKMSDALDSELENIKPSDTSLSRIYEQLEQRQELESSEFVDYDTLRSLEEEIKGLDLEKLSISINDINMFLSSDLSRVLLTLTPAERIVMLKSFGIGDTDVETLTQIAKDLDVTYEMIRTIRDNAYKGIKHPSNYSKVKDYIK